MIGNSSSRQQESGTGSIEGVDIKYRRSGYTFEAKNIEGVKAI